MTTAVLPTPAERRAMLLEAFGDGKTHTAGELAERFGWSTTAVRRDFAPDLAGGVIEQVRDDAGAVVGFRLARVVAAAPQPTGNVSSWIEAEVFLDELVLDPVLQCRGGIDAATKDRYVTLLQDGGEFRDRARAIRVEGRLFLVDGWHREAATREAFKGTPKLRIEYRDGTRRDAILEAVRANSSHGLPRSPADKRRAVRTLLMDPEWCALSTRKLGELADVSHKHVGDIRKEYGVVAGELLTPERAELVDGEPTPEWRKFLDAASGWDRPKIDALRKAATPEALLTAAREAANAFVSRREEAFRLRQVELATASDWPWPQDGFPFEREKRAGRLDTREDLLAAVACRACPQLATLYDVLLGLECLGTHSASHLRDLLERWKGRPALLELLQKQIAKVEKATAEQPWMRVNEVRNAKSDPDRQAQLLEALPKSLLHMIPAGALAPSVRDGVYRKLVGADGRDAGPCADSACTGWVEKEQHSSAACVVCRQDPEHLQREIRKSLRATAILLERPGFGVRIAGVVVDRQGAELLAALEAAAADGTLGSADVQRELRTWAADVQRELRTWAARKLPDLVVAAEEEGEDLEDDGDPQ